MAQKLVEKIEVGSEVVNRLPLKESNIKVQNTSYSVDAAFEVPIWRIGERNLNNRTYGRRVAEKVVQESKTTLALGDHPSDEGSVWNIVAVAKNPHIRDGLLWADAYFVDEAMAQKIDRIVEHGGQIGLSSSAYGDVDKEGNVLSENFEVERYFDLVLEPSYQVYIGHESSPRLSNQTQTETVTSGALPSRVENPPEDEDENEDEESERKKKRNKKRNTKPSFMDLTIEDKGIQTKEHNMAKTESLYEANYRMNIRSLMKSAEAQETPFEKKKAYQEVAEYLDEDVVPELSEQVNTRLDNLTQEIEQLAEKGNEADDLRTKAEEAESKKSELQEELDKQSKVYESKLESLQNKYEKANETITNLREHIEESEAKATLMEAERNGKVKAADYVNLLKAFQEQKEINEDLETRLTKAQKEASKQDRSTKSSEKKTRSSRTKESAHRVRKVHKPISTEESSEKETSSTNDRRSRVRPNRANRSQEQAKPTSQKSSDGMIDLNFQNEDEVVQYYKERVAEDARYERFKDDILGCKTLQEAQIKAMSLDLDSVPQTKQDKVVETKETPSPVDEADNFIRRQRRKGWV